MSAAAPDYETLRATNVRLVDVAQEYRAKLRALKRVVILLLFAAFFTHLAAAFGATYLERERVKRLNALQDVLRPTCPAPFTRPQQSRRECVEACFVRDRMEKIRPGKPA